MNLNAHKSVGFHSFILLTCIAAQAQNAPARISDRLDKLVTERFSATKCPGLSVAVAAKNQIIFSKAMGMADIEQGLNLTTNSVHRLASLSKPITGTIIMDLVEQGKLDLDVSVRKYLSELPAAYQRISLRHLLTHQSGVRGYINPADIVFSAAHYPTSRAVLKTFMDVPLAFEPGTKVEYSSMSFTVAAAAAESVTGHSFQELSTDFFARNGISGLFLDDPLAVVPARVRGYLVDRNSKMGFNNGQDVARDYLIGTPGEITNARFYDISNRYPAGGFDSSAEGLMRFVIAVGTGKVLKSETVKMMWTAKPTSDGTKTVFGLGWGVSEWKGNPMVGMNGADLSTQAFLRYLPNSGVGVVVACNAEGAQGLPELVSEILENTN